MNHWTRGLFFLLLAGLSASLWAQESETDAERDAGPVIELESRVTGNREQPQVFHVVPWQTPESPEPDYDPLERQLESVFGHVERDELQRTLRQREETVEIAD
ncbi:MULTISPECIES: hypothetical protein [unclassified Marinimicrobium]|jgi:hypothetical protein|uniref:hypothetical protein n=1 Tax=unclassified Marinimicrobium TaxID=2632100 RepID=UPI000C6312AE|nr:MULTISPECIES: hypothetical protein [unclassified Marinimicrobium]MAN51258.1 hypothetical protein [Marinimicrobium sp.]|tara:strand:- start:549 stop:857 length:309 start_codon:yes stop_codon:yes gene_type:complete